jgi:chromate reductase
MTVRVLAFAGALRKGSWNRKLIALGVERARAAGAEVDALDMREIDMPLYDGDLEAERGFPEGAALFRERLSRAGALLIASPEYNASIPGTLKNALDWASRPPSPPFRGKVAAILSASPGMAGGGRMQPDLRKVLSATGVFVVPASLAVSQADRAFDAEGRLPEALMKQLDGVVKQLLETAAKLGA